MDKKWWTLVVVCTAIFMLLLDITIVNVALPKIQDQLNASFSDLQWVVDAYLLVFTALLLAAGNLGDRWGRRRMLAIGLVAFGAPSALAGSAPSSINRRDVSSPCTQNRSMSASTRIFLRSCAMTKSVGV